MAISRKKHRIFQICHFRISDEMMIQIFAAVEMAASDWLLARLKTTNQVAPHAALAT